MQLRSLEFHQLSSDDCQDHCQSSFDRCHWSFQAPYSAVSAFLTASAFSGGFASASTLRHSMCGVLVYFHHEMISGRPFCKVSTPISATKIGTNSIQYFRNTIKPTCLYLGSFTAGIDIYEAPLNMYYICLIYLYIYYMHAKNQS